MGSSPHSPLTPTNLQPPPDGSMQNRNNLLTVCFIASLLFLCCLPLTWFTGNTSSFGVFQFAQATGRNANISLLVALPIWFLLVVSASSTLIVASNIAAITSIPKIAPAIGLLFSGVHYAAPFFIIRDRYKVEAGPIVAIVATLVVLRITLKYGGRPNGGSSL